jgi:VCBS repeat-containing protein
VALAVVLVVGKALETALSGPVPSPIAIPIYMVLLAAYQRLTEIAYNHVPVAGTPSTPLQVPVTGTIIGDIGTATDQDGDPLNYKVTTQPTKGTVTLIGTVYTYTPSAAMLRDGGTDSFTVTIDDLQGAADHFYAPNGHTITETINLDVVGTGIDIPPLVTATQGARDSIGVAQGGFTVVDPDDTTHTFSLANGNSAGATATSAFTNLGGIVSLNPTTGNWTYIPAVSGNLLGIPTHTDSFVVTVDDGHAGGAVQTTVLVGADLETAVTGASTNQTNGAYSGTLNIPAADTGLLTYSVGTPPSSKGSVLVTPAGSFTYTPTAAARHAAAADNATTADKTDSFTIVGTDANGRQVTVATVPVTISTTNAAPTASYSLASPGSNGLVTGIIMANDGDNDTLSYGPTTINTGKGTVTVNATAGTFSYQPTATAMHEASADNATTTDKQDTFAISVDDGHGGVTSVPVTVSITAQNTAPTVNYGSPVKVLGIATYTPSYSDADGDVPTVTITTQPTNGTVAVNVSVLGLINTIVYAANNTLIPAHDSFIVTVSDGHGGTVVTTLHPY